jgi:hypothetical protein
MTMIMIMTMIMPKIMGINIKINRIIIHKKLITNNR